MAVDAEESGMALPLELICTIGCFLKCGSASLARLASTSKAGNEVLAPVLYGTVSARTLYPDTKLPRWFIGPEREKRARWITGLLFSG
jgi:hypothetical protein